MLFSLTKSTNCIEIEDASYAYHIILWEMGYLDMDIILSGI